VNRPGLGPCEDLQRFSGVHRAVSVGQRIEADSAVEVLAGVHGAFEEAGQQRLDLGPGGGGAAGEGNVSTVLRRPQPPA
jgi:hypothetical protein